MALSPITKFALFGIAAIAIAQSYQINTLVATKITALPVYGQTAGTTPTPKTTNPSDPTADLLKNLAPIYIPANKNTSEPTPTSLAQLDNLTTPPPAPVASAPYVKPDALMPPLTLQAISFSNTHQAATINDISYLKGQTVFVLDSVPWILHSVSPSSVTLRPQKNHSTKTQPLSITLRLS